MTDHLKEAKKFLYDSEGANLEYGYLCAAQSIAHALIALVERLDRVMEHTHTSEDGHKFYNLQVQVTT
jgi:hypothetical protein